MNIWEYIKLTWPLWAFLIVAIIGFAILAMKLTPTV